MNIWTLLIDGVRFLEKAKTKIISSYYKKRFSVSSIYIQYPCRIIGDAYIKVAGGLSSLSGLRLECIDNYNGYSYNPRLFLGKNISFNSNCHVGCINEIEIGDNVLIGSNVLITDHSHGKWNHDLQLSPNKRPLWSKGKIKIGSGCWIGENVCILPNVNIGNDCIIGAGSVITKDIPSYSVVVGNPQKIIRTLSSINQ